MKREYEVVFQEIEDGWIMATVPDLPGAVTQGRDMAEARANIQEAIELIQGIDCPVGSTRMPGRQIQPVVKIVRLGEEEGDRVYWLSQSPQARWEAVEEIRREYHGWQHGSEPRLQRVCAIIKRQPSEVSRRRRVRGRDARTPALHQGPRRVD